MIVSLTGFMGCGKSSVGRKLSSLLEWKFIDLDEYIVHKAGMSIPDIMGQGGESYFRAIEAEALRDVVTMSEITGEDLVLSLGGGTITIGATRHLITEHSESFYLKASLETLTERLQGGMDSRPLLKDGRMEERLKTREPLYEMAAHVIETDGKTVDAIADEIAAIVRK